MLLLRRKCVLTTLLVGFAALAAGICCVLNVNLSTVSAIGHGIHPYTAAVAASVSKRVTVRRMVAPIPRVIVITNKDKDEFMASRAALWQALNPLYKIITFDNSDCARFLEAHYGSAVRGVFDGVRDGPIKADMFRVFYLYRHGGVYVDVDMIPLVPLADALPSSAGLFVPRSRHAGQLNPTLIAASPGHDTLGAATEVYFALSRGFVYSYWSWSVVHILSALQFCGAPVDVFLHETCPAQNMNECTLNRNDGTAVVKLRGADYDMHNHRPRKVEK